MQTKTRIRLKTPTNIQEFIEFGWNKKLRYKINSFHLNDSLNNPEDLENDIILSLIETDYISRFDPERGAFSTYIYTFVDNFLKKRYNRENTKNGSRIVQAARLEISAPDINSTWNGSTIYADLITTNEDFTDKLLIEETIDSITHEIDTWTSSEVDTLMQALPQRVKGMVCGEDEDFTTEENPCESCIFSGVKECGDCLYKEREQLEAKIEGNRLQHKIFVLMLTDMDSGDIANKLGVSRQTVNIIRNGIQQCDAFKAFKSYLLDSPILNFHANKPTS